METVFNGPETFVKPVKARLGRPNIVSGYLQSGVWQFFGYVQDEALIDCDPATPIKEKWAIEGVS